MWFHGTDISVSAHLRGFLHNLDINEQKLKTEVTQVSVNDTDPSAAFYYTVKHCI